MNGGAGSAAAAVAAIVATVRADTAVGMLERARRAVLLVTLPLSCTFWNPSKPAPDRMDVLTSITAVVDSVVAVALPPRRKARTSDCDRNGGHDSP